MAVTFDSLRSEVLRYAHEAPLVLVRDLLRESARDFFARSHAWRETYTIPLVDGTHTYDLADETLDPTILPSTLDGLGDFSYFDVDVVSWHDVVYNGEQALQKRLPRARRQDQPEPTAIFWGYENPTPTTIRLTGTPGATEATNELVVTVSLKPSRQTLGVDSDDMVNLYKDAIVNGAVARLMLIPRQPWSNPGQSQYHNARFEESILDADNRAQSQYSRRVTRVTGYGGL